MCKMLVVRLYGVQIMKSGLFLLEKYIKIVYR